MIFICEKLTCQWYEWPDFAFCDSPGGVLRPQTFSSDPVWWLFRLIDLAVAVKDRDKDNSLNLAGDLLEESQSEASRLRQRVEELVRDNEALKSSSFAASLCMGGPIQTETQSRSCRLKDDLEFNFGDVFSLFLDLARAAWLKPFETVWLILGKPCLHPTAEQEEEQTSCIGKTLQPEKPNVSPLYVLIVNTSTPGCYDISHDIWQLSASRSWLFLF